MVAQMLLTVSAKMLSCQSYIEFYILILAQKSGHFTSSDMHMEIMLICEIDVAM